MHKQYLLLAVCLLLISGCSRSMGTLPPTPTVQNVIDAAVSTLPAPFPTIPPLTPTSSSSPTPFTAFTVKPSVDNLKVRVNPGYLFEALMMVQQTDELTVLGISPGSEWAYIKTSDGTEGWVFSQFLTSTVDLTKVPVREPKNVTAIKGRVMDISGLPISGISFSLIQTGSTETPGNAVQTDTAGNFYAFLPDTASGSWTLSFSGINCTSIVWADSTCAALKPGFTGNIDPQTMAITLPQTGEPPVFTFR